MKREKILYYSTQAIYYTVLLFGCALLGFSVSEKMYDMFPDFATEFLIFFFSVVLIVTGFILCIINRALHIATINIIKQEKKEAAFKAQIEEEDVEVIIPEDENEAEYRVFTEI